MRIVTAKIGITIIHSTNCLNQTFWAGNSLSITLTSAEHLLTAFSGSFGNLCRNFSIFLSFLALTFTLDLCLSTLTENREATLHTPLVISSSTKLPPDHHQNCLCHFLPGQYDREDAIFWENIGNRCYRIFSHHIICKVHFYAALTEVDFFLNKV